MASFGRHVSGSHHNMWRWTVILCLLIFYGHVSSQPLTDESENVRQARQLDFGECCPCPGSGQDFGPQESPMLSGDGPYARSRDVDDCPCRGRNADSEGASSMFFPMSMRSEGEVVRPVDQKEDPKPLLHPEVDLASSVLQTLREATDEEYEDALARDAARSMAKAAEETLFGDAVPEASNGNIVTIIVKPKHTDDLDDVIPQESRNQESRCKHAPLENRKQMRVASKPPNLLREFFGLPRLSKSAGNLDRNLLDMDNGASNIQERVAHIDDEQMSNKSITGLRKYSPKMKLDTTLNAKSTNFNKNVDDDNILKKVPDFNLSSMKKKLKDLISNRPPLEGRGETNSLPLIPKMKINNSLTKAKGINNEDLSLSPSNIQEHAKLSFFQTKSHLENKLQKTRPVSLKNLLKLKDVEFIPLKDLVQKSSDKPLLNMPKLGLPNIFNKENNLIRTNKDINPINLAKSEKIIAKIPHNNEDEIFDHDVSPSNIIERVSEDNCDDNQAIKTSKINGSDTEHEVNSSERNDIKSNLPNIHTNVSEEGKDPFNGQSDELVSSVDDCQIKTSPVAEENLPQSKENTFDSDMRDINKNEHSLDISKEVTPVISTPEADLDPKEVSNDADCDSNNMKEADSITDSSHSLNNVLEPTDTVLENVDDILVTENTGTAESCSQELPATSHTPNGDSQTKLIKPLSLDKTLSNIKENIIKNLKTLKKTKTSPKSSDNFEQAPNKFIEATESSAIPEVKLDSDCQNEESIQVTTINPDINEDNLSDLNETSNNVSMQDLQKISDSMLQQEEQNKESNHFDCDEPLQEEINPKVPLQVNSREIEVLEPEPSANSQNEVIIDPQTSVDIEEQSEDIENTCQRREPKLSNEQESDANAEASEIVINTIPKSIDDIGSPFLLEKVMQPNEININLLNHPIPVLPELKLAPIPSLDEMESRLTDLFDKPIRDAEGAQSIADSAIDKANVMSTDASTPSFQSRLADVNLDVLQLKPHSNLFSKIPKLDLHSLKTKLPSPTDLLMKPSKLQSALNPWESKPNLNSLGSRMKTNNQKAAKMLRHPDVLRNSLVSNQGLDLFNNKNNLRALDSKFKGSIQKPVNFQTEDLLETISRNHEDINDKLRALHIDFNDRIETMRNNLFDKSMFGNDELRSTKSFNVFNKKNKDKDISLNRPRHQPLSSRKDSTKNLKLETQKLEQQREAGLKSSQRLSNKRKFKMSPSASVPVPKTIEVPELKTTLQKSPGFLAQRISAVNPNIQNTEASQGKKTSVISWRQASKKLPTANAGLGKAMNPFKDSKIKVSFSTTPQPLLPTRLQSRKSSPSSSVHTTGLGKSTGRFIGQREDHNGSPSEMKHSIVSPPISSNVDRQKLENIGLGSENRQTGASNIKPNFEVKTEPAISKNFKSWPRLSESAFLSKVKEAVKARLTKVNSPITSKQADVQSRSSSINQKEEVHQFNTDMARSASENTDIIERPALKENVSYKCTMVCTKE